MLFQHYQKLSFTFFDNRKVGELLSRVTSDLFDITEFAHHCPEEFLITWRQMTIPDYSEKEIFKSLLSKANYLLRR